MKKKTIDGIEYLIKRMVEWQVKMWCSDIRSDGSLSLLGGLTALATADHMAFNCGDPNGEWIGDFEVSAHIRSYKELMKFDDHNTKTHMDWDLINVFNAMDYYDYPKVNGKHVDPIQYFRSPEGEDSLILFLLRSPKKEIKPKELSISSEEKTKEGKFKNIIGGTKVSKNTLETPEERAARHTRESIEDDDRQLNNGRIIAAVELSATRYGREVKDADGNVVHTYQEARDIYNNALLNGEDEHGAYKLMSNTERAWMWSGIQDVIDLFYQYALRNLGDIKFLKELTKNLPEFAIFKDEDAAEAAEKAQKEGKPIDYSTMYKL